MSKKILITDKVDPLLPDGLSDMGFECHYHPQMPYLEVMDVLPAFQGVVVNSKVICNKEFLNIGRHLEFVARLGSGLDIIDIPYAKQLGIEVISSPEGNANAVGEHVLGMLLTLLHRINIADSNVREGRWLREQNRGKALKGQTVGIIGFGHTGPAFAQKLRGMGVNVLVYDKYNKVDKTQFPEVVQVELSNLLKRSDIVSLHIPLTAETENMVDRSFLDRMQKGSILINSSRGRILKTSDLRLSMEEGRIGGVCLDVLENERPNTWSNEEARLYSFFQESNRAVLTPHIAGWTFESLRLIASVLLTKIQNFYGL